MNRNTTVFDRDQTAINISRSKQDLSHGYKGTFNAGKLYPLWTYSDILPADTIKAAMTSVIRMSTPIAPVLDDCYADVYVFFTPHKQVLQRYAEPYGDTSYSWKYFIGAQDYYLNMPLPASDIKLPVIGFASDNSAAQGIGLGSFYERVGLPVGIHLKEGVGAVGDGSLYVHALDYLAYISVWNDFFRDENTQQPVGFGFSDTLDDTASILLYGGPEELNGVTIYSTNCAGTGETSILPVSRPHGYFGSAIPFPQRSANGVTIPLLGAAVVEADGNIVLSGYDAADDPVSGLTFFANVSSPTAAGNSANSGIFNPSGNQNVKSYSPLAYEKGLKVDLSDVSSVTVNQFRALVAKQHYLEALARGGNRLGEMTSSLFGVKPHDSGEEHSEYLGGVRIPITVSEVAQMAQNANGKGLGNLGAYSKTVDMSFLSEKSFDTWGTYQIFIAFRTAESFCQGIARKFTRRTREDFYYPAFARIGDQPILNKEIYAIDVADDLEDNDEVFGYQSAWAEYRYEPNLVTGLLRPNQSLGYFTYCNNFNTIPTLASYLEGGEGIAANVDRTLQANAETGGFQFIGDFWFDIEAIRPLPADTRPGLTRI